jgi:hypothetical protein
VFQTQQSIQSQEKVFPHEKAQLKLNYDNLLQVHQKYHLEQQKVRGQCYGLAF